MRTQDASIPLPRIQVIHSLVCSLFQKELWRASQAAMPSVDAPALLASVACVWPFVIQNRFLSSLATPRVWSFCINLVPEMSNPGVLLSRLSLLYFKHPSGSFFLHCGRNRTQGLSGVSHLMSGSSFNSSPRAVHQMDNFSAQDPEGLLTLVWWIVLFIKESFEVSPYQNVSLLHALSTDFPPISCFTNVSNPFVSLPYPHILYASHLTAI